MISDLAVVHYPELNHTSDASEIVYLLFNLFAYVETISQNLALVEIYLKSIASIEHIFSGRIIA